MKRPVMFDLTEPMLADVLRTWIGQHFTGDLPNQTHVERVLTALAVKSEEPYGPAATERVAKVVAMMIKDNPAFWEDYRAEARLLLRTVYGDV